MQLEIRVLPPLDAKQPFRFGAYSSGDNGNDAPVAEIADDVEEYALGRLVEAVYKLRSQEAFREQGYRCFVCSTLSRGLTADHILPRAHGRLDTRRNLRGVCQPCHVKITSNKIRPEPHPEVLRFAEQHGWTWGPESEKIGWVRTNDAP